MNNISSSSSSSIGKTPKQSDHWKRVDAIVFEYNSVMEQLQRIQKRQVDLEFILDELRQRLQWTVPPVIAPAAAALSTPKQGAQPISQQKQPQEHENEKKEEEETSPWISVQRDRSIQGRPLSTPGPGHRRPKLRQSRQRLDFDEAVDETINRKNKRKRQAEDEKEDADPWMENVTFH